LLPFSRAAPMITPSLTPARLERPQRTEGVIRGGSSPALPPLRGNRGRAALEPAHPAVVARLGDAQVGRGDQAGVSVSVSISCFAAVAESRPSGHFTLTLAAEVGQNQPPFCSTKNRSPIPIGFPAGASAGRVTTGPSRAVESATPTRRRVLHLNNAPTPPKCRRRRRAVQPDAPSDSSNSRQHLLCRSPRRAPLLSAARLRIARAGRASGFEGAGWGKIRAVWEAGGRAGSWEY